MTRHPKHFVLLAVLSIVTFVCPAIAQQGLEMGHLQRSIEQTRKHLQAERKRIEQEDKAQRKELEDAKKQQQLLVEQMVELKFNVAEKQSELNKKQGELETLKRNNDISGHQWTDIRIIATDACRKLSTSLDLMPPSESREKQRQLLGKIEASLKDKTQTHIALEPLVELMESLLLESRTSSVFGYTIRDGQGYEQQAEIFRLGQILYAHKTQSGQVAIASAPSEDSINFRWNDDLPAWAKDSITRAIEDKDVNTNQFLLPIDVTQQIAIEQGYSKSGLLGKITAGGPVMIPLAIIALLAMVLIIERSIFFNIQGRKTTVTAESILAACHEGDFARAEQIAAENPNVISRTMLSCLSVRSKSTADMEDAIAETVLHELPALERFLSSIGILAGVAPLLGLLGTVTGMISTFDIITVFGSGEPKLMAGGISEALITTAAGLVIAIPILLVHSYLSTRSDNLIADTERYSATLLNLLKMQTEKSSKSEGM